MKTSIIKKTHQKGSKSIIMRIPKNMYKDFERIGNGDLKKGEARAIEAYNILHLNPEIKLMYDVDVLMTDLKMFYGNNHYVHYQNFPAHFRSFLKKGFPDFSIMAGPRLEKPIDDFGRKKEKEDDKDGSE